jgi:hypothetical protein
MISRKILAVLTLLFFVVVPVAAETMITASNETIYITNYQPFVDWKIWAIFLLFAIICMVASHLMPRGNELWALLGFIFCIVALWCSMGVAVINEPVAYNLGNSTNVNMSFYYSVRTLSSTWLTIVMIIIAILALLNNIYVYIEIVQKRAQQQMADTQAQQEIANQEVYKWKR